MIRSLLDRARAAGVRLWVEGGKLRYRTSAGPLAADLREQLTAHREELIHHLSTEATTANVHRPVVRFRLIQGQGRGTAISAEGETLPELLAGLRDRYRNRLASVFHGDREIHR